jgi:hypothetical protein
VRRCAFDGLNNQNRNGISILDCDGMLVEQCTFRRLTRSDMPGSIDMEPNADLYYRLRNIRIVGNKFSNTGGNVAVISLVIATGLTQMPQDIVIEDNIIEDTNGTAFAFIQHVPPAPGTKPQNLVVRNNRVYGNFVRPFVLLGINGLSFTHNQFEGGAQAGQVGFTQPESVVRNLTFEQNSFSHCGSEGGTGFLVFSVSDVRIVGNDFVDCGNGKPASYVFDFNVGNSERVVFQGNRFRSPTGKTKYIVQKEARHTFNAGSNVFAPDNHVDPGLRSAFEATGSGR